MSEPSVETSEASITCFVSPKGGSGKTVVCAGLASILSSLGFKVLMIDADEATSGMTMLYLRSVLARKRQGDYPSSLYDVGKDGLSRSAELTHLGDLLDLAPAAYATAVMKNDAIGVASDRLSATIANARKRYDYVLIDAEAGGDPRAIMALNHADEVVVVSEWDPISAQGTVRLQQALPDLLAPEKTWILYNKVLPEFIGAIGDSFLEVVRYLSPVPWDADVVRSLMRSELAVNLEAPNTHTLALMRTIDAVFPGARPAVEAWRGELRDKNHSEIASQIGSIEKKISAVESALSRTTSEVVSRNSPGAAINAIGRIAIMAAGVLALLVASLVGLFGSSLIESLVGGAAALIGAVLAIVTLTYVRRRADSERRKMRDLGVQQDVLRTKLYELMETRDKLRVADLQDPRIRGSQ